MSFTEHELKKECEAWAYAAFYSILGGKAGGVITTLLKRKGIRGSRAVFVEAARAADPKAYVGGVLRKAADDLNNALPIGTRMGNYVWDGGKWKEEPLPK